MKTILKRALAIIFFITLFAIGNIRAQSSWSTGRYYASRGESKIHYQYNQVWDYNYMRYVTVRSCNRMDWYQEYHSGYVYYWRYNSYYNRYEWQYEWKEGYFWYYNWTGWYTC